MIMTKRILSMVLMAAAMMLFAGCEEKEEAPTNTNGGVTRPADEPDTTSGSTRPSDDEPDTTTGSTRPAEGAIAEGRIGIGSFTADGQTVQNVYGIDFNRDGVLEYRIVDNGLALTYDNIENNVVVTASGELSMLQKHSAINSTLNYGGNGNTSLPALYTLPEKSYVACCLTMSDGIHYGWIKVKYDDGELEWDECAYNTVPGATITAGDD